MKTLIGAILILGMFSCKSTRNVQKFTKQIDSTGFFKADTSRVLRIDSTVVGSDKVIHISADTNDYEEWTIIEEDSAKKKTITHVRDKGIRHTKVITISKDSTGLKKTDSVTGSRTQATAVKETLKGKGVEVKKTQGGLWWNLALILAVLLGLYWVYQKYIKPRFL